MGSDGRKYRILVSGSERTTSGKPRDQSKHSSLTPSSSDRTDTIQAEVIDFDLASAILNPHYAMPSSRGLDREIILHRDERIAKLSFVNLKDVLKFQQAVTGFKAWASYCEYDVLVSFVVAGLKDPIVEKACVQLWIPKPVEGALVTNQDVTKDSGNGPSREGSMARSATGVYSSSPDPQHRGRDNSGTWSTRGPEPIPTVNQQQRNPTILSTHRTRYESPGPMGSSPPRGTMFSHSMPTPPSSHPRQIPRKPVGTSSPFPQAPASPRSSGPLSSSPTQMLSSSPQRIGTTFGSSLNVPNMPQSRRAQSISSNVSNSAFSNSNSSGSDAHTLTISTGSNTTGYLHQRPLKPRLVLFTQNPKDGQRSFVSIDVDDETTINPERCDCRRSGKEGARCAITSIERRKGSANLEAKRYKTSRMREELDWNLARLASNSSFLSSASPSLAAASTEGEETAWPNVKRVSFMFSTPQARAKFGGSPSECRCVNRTNGELKECLRLGHKGFLGEVQEYHRIQMNNYHQVRYESHQQVVNSPLM